MYLKSIEIQGFKSFANKILFEFHNGITGIVGPNGSGKSNVADAVRWVLGEQRIKQLRGASMQDVIFSGTELKKPQGFAYVAITLDNSDHQLPISYDQVTVSRRVYRSGESEYMINGSACRLKDINELFYDTGIGKEGYSIIGQGQIDRILSGKPEERRELFDEAAGIVKFKRRKAIALKKLEDEKQNLVRVNDILCELEKQVGPLKRQSEAAREYLRLKEELKVWDANLFLLEHDALRKLLEENGEKENIISKDLEGARADSASLKEEYDKLDHMLSELDQEITAGREEISRSDVQRGNLEGRINVLKEQINTEKINEEHIKSRILALRQEISEKAGQKEQYANERESLTGSIRDILVSLREAEKQIEKQDSLIRCLDEKIGQGKSEIIRILNEKAGISAKQQRYATMLEQVNIRRSEVCQKLLRFKSDESVQEEQLKIEYDRLEKIVQKIEDYKETENRLLVSITESEEEVRRLSHNLNNKQQEYHTSYTKLESLRNLAERYEGYGNSIRKVMEVKDRIYGIHGVVADLITVEKKFEIAIETALGGSIQNIVTDSEQTAKQLIEYLKKNKFGRATFLPLTSIANKNISNQDRILKEPGVIGLAHELVKVDREYEGLAKYLLGRVIVTETIDHAITLSRKYQYSLRIVTLEGELLNPGGSMTGGAFKNTSNLLGRKREIEELEERCIHVIADVEEIQKDLAMNEGLLSESKENLNQVKSYMQSAYLDQNTVQMNISQMEKKKLEISESSSDMVLENQELEEQIRDIRESQDQLFMTVKAMETENEGWNQEVDKCASQLEDTKKIREESSKALAQIQLSAANLQQQNQFMQENISRVSEEIRKLEEELTGLSSGTVDSNAVIEEKLNEIAGLEEQIGAERKRSGELESTINSQTALKEIKYKEQREFFKKREELSERINLLDKDLFRVQNQKEKLNEKLEGHVNYIWSEYEMTYSLAEALKKDGFSSSGEVRRGIDGLKGSIRALGNVNVNAIEDYKEVSERYEFMKTQHDDLTQAEDTLQKIIAELDTGMRMQFEEKFREIRQEFDKVFRELFGGGHGTLELMEGEDILEAGIQIISQPPGKKLQNMMQLSGGEKALTAISLLFAIQNLKPSPFCLLDEIEAALDDSNVDRFAKYLHKLTANTQFIVITHRRGTMVAADRLYGITMQEKGVSTLVSVNLIEDELDK